MGEGSHISTTCPECGAPAEFDIPGDALDPTVIFEPPCGHRTRIANPHAPVADEGATGDDGTEHVGLADGGVGIDATA